VNINTDLRLKKKQYLQVEWHILEWHESHIHGL